jgi:hypothetical protein
MRAHRPSTRILILLCLLALQTQLFASSAMACKHVRTTDDRTASVCPFHEGESASPRAADDTDAMLDCQKCVLGLFFGVYHLIAPTSSIGLADKAPVEAKSGFKHFYRFDPDRLYRPPISLFS